MRTNRILAGGLAGLGGLIVVYAILGPLVLDVIHFRTTAAGLNQIRGGDLAALVVVAPACLAVAWLAWRGHRAAPVLALAPATFAMYTYSQLILGNEYLHQPGNVERFFPLLLAMFILAAAVVLRCWGQVRPEALPSSTRRLQRGSGILLSSWRHTSCSASTCQPCSTRFATSRPRRSTSPCPRPSGWSSSTTSASSPPPP